MLNSRVPERRSYKKQSCRRESLIYSQTAASKGCFTSREEQTNKSASSFLSRVQEGTISHSAIDGAEITASGLRETICRRYRRRWILRLCR